MLHSSKRVIVEDTVTNMKKAPDTTKTNNSLGDLSLFPREIRDEIYRHSLSKEDYYGNCILTSARIYDASLSSKLRKRTQSNVSILCLSKAIKEEAMTWLYLNGTFVFWYNLDQDRHFPQHPSTNNMNKIEIFYDAALYLDLNFESDFSIRWNTSISYGSMRAGPLDFFRGDTITRKSILIVIELCKWWPYATAITKSPLFDTFKQLTGFETVTLRLAVADDGSGEWPKANEWEGLYTGFGSVLKDISMCLGPTLGKSSAVSELIPEQIGPSLENSENGIREVVFHPRNDQTAISEAKKDKQLASHGYKRAPSDLTS